MTARGERTNLASCMLTRYRDIRFRGEADPRDSRFRGDADPRDLNLAVEILQEAVARTPPGAPALVSRLNSLGVGLKYRFQCDHDAGDLERGRTALGRASGPEGARDVRWSLAAALTLAGWASERGTGTKQPTLTGRHWPPPRITCGSSWSATARKRRCGALAAFTPMPPIPSGAPGSPPRPPSRSSVAVPSSSASGSKAP